MFYIVTFDIILILNFRPILNLNTFFKMEIAEMMKIIHQNLFNNPLPTTVEVKIYLILAKILSFLVTTSFLSNLACHKFFLKNNSCKIVAFYDLRLWSYGLHKFWPQGRFCSNLRTLNHCDFFVFFNLPT